MRNRPLL